MFFHVEKTFMESQEKKYTEWKNGMSMVLPFIVCFAQKNQAEWTEARTGAVHRLPMGQATGIPTQSFQTGGLLGALHMRAPLTEEAVITMDIRGWSYRQSFPKSVFTSIFGIYSLFSFNQSSNSSVNSRTWTFLSRSHHIHLQRHLLVMLYAWPDAGSSAGLVRPSHSF